MKSTSCFLRQINSKDIIPFFEIHLSWFKYNCHGCIHGFLCCCIFYVFIFFLLYILYFIYLYITYILYTFIFFIFFMFLSCILWLMYLWLSVKFFSLYPVKQVYNLALCLDLYLQSLSCSQVTLGRVLVFWKQALREYTAPHHSARQR